jgi:hypothetical protein
MIALRHQLRVRRMLDHCEAHQERKRYAKTTSQTARPQEQRHDHRPAVEAEPDAATGARASQSSSG